MLVHRKHTTLKFMLPQIYCKAIGILCLILQLLVIVQSYFTKIYPGLEIRSFAHLHFVLLLKIVHFKEQTMSDVSDLRVIWANRSWFERITWTIRFWQFFPFFISKRESLFANSLFFLRVTLMIRSRHSLQKSNCDRFPQVAHDKRAMGAICSFSRANCSFAHKKWANCSKNWERIPNPGFIIFCCKEIWLNIFNL